MGLLPWPNLKLRPVTMVTTQDSMDTIVDLDISKTGHLTTPMDSHPPATDVAAKDLLRLMLSPHIMVMDLMDIMVTHMDLDTVLMGLVLPDTLLAPLTPTEVSKD